jgi:membrane associated rhomboid family serine protease
MPAPTTAPRRLPAPYVTLALCVICAFVFAAIRGSGPESWAEAVRRGHLPAGAVWSGGYWSLLTSAFMHFAVWHVLMNVYWLWTLGRFVELVLGPWRLVALVVVSAVVSSALQLAVSDTTGIGASGVVYALFGVMWGGRKKVALFGHIMGQVAYVFWIWLPIGYLLTRLEVLNIGNAAHLGGMLTGIVAARELFFPERRRLAHAAAALLLGAAILPLFWAPWSAAWIGHRATRAHLDGRYDEAIAGYLEAMGKGADRVWMLQNIALARHAKGDEAGYHAALAQLRRLDPRAAEEIESRY